jgi:hypothetical protein
LQDSEAALLAKKFDFTGGQIENIARKYIVDSVLSGEKVPLETLVINCQNEYLARENQHKKLKFLNNSIEPSGPWAAALAGGWILPLCQKTSVQLKSAKTRRFYTLRAKKNRIYHYVPIF